MNSPRTATLVLLDFDGTLTERDGDYLVADALLGPDRQGAYAPFAEAYERLEVSVAGYFERYFELLNLAQPVDAVARAGANIPLRRGARQLVEFCRSQALQVRIASEGLDAYIRPALLASGLEVELSCNRLVLDNGTLRVLAALDAESCFRCMSCKATHVRRAHEQGSRVIVVGDGASDLCAAREADLVIARGSLRRHCERERIEFVGWETLEGVADAIRSYVGTLQNG